MISDYDDCDRGSQFQVEAARKEGNLKMAALQEDVNRKEKKEESIILYAGSFENTSHIPEALKVSRDGQISIIHGNGIHVLVSFSIKQCHMSKNWHNNRDYSFSITGSTASLTSTFSGLCCFLISFFKCMLHFFLKRKHKKKA